MCHYTHFTTEERELSRDFNPKGLALWQLPECLIGRRLR